jgi:hypothetical protein
MRIKYFFSFNLNDFPEKLEINNKNIAYLPFISPGSFLLIFPTDEKNSVISVNKVFGFNIFSNAEKIKEIRRGTIRYTLKRKYKNITHNINITTNGPPDSSVSFEGGTGSNIKHNVKKI